MIDKHFGGKMILWWGMGCLVLLLAACLPQGVQIPESPLLRALERKSGLISYVGLDGNIYTSTRRKPNWDHFRCQAGR
jgi:hypothetical protein